MVSGRVAISHLAGRSGWSKSQVNGWEVLDPCWELLGLLVSQGDLDQAEGMGSVGLPERIISTAGRGPLFLEVFYNGLMPLRGFCAFPPQQQVGKGKPIVWNRGCR